MIYSSCCSFAPACRATNEPLCCALPTDCLEVGATNVSSARTLEVSVESGFALLIDTSVTRPRLGSTIYTQFTLKSPIKVMRTDLLEKEQGVSELYRNTYVKAIMRGDGSFLVLWSGASVNSCFRTFNPLSDTYVVNWRYHPHHAAPLVLPSRRCVCFVHAIHWLNNCCTPIALLPVLFAAGSGWHCETGASDTRSSHDYPLTLGPRASC